MLRQYSPLVETYIQMLRQDPTLGPQPAGDKYFLGKAQLARGVALESFSDEQAAGPVRRKVDRVTDMFSFEFLPARLFADDLCGSEWI